MADDVLITGGIGAAPQQYEVPNATEIIPKCVCATFNGTAAGSSFFPTVQIISDGGVVVAEIPTDTAVAAGGSATVTFAPFLRAPCPETTSAYQTVVTADGPVFYLPLEEPSGVTCADATGHGHTGTINGSYSRPTDSGLAGVHFGVTLGTTTSDFIDIPSAAALDVLGEVTLECWYYPTSFFQSAYLMSKGKSGTNAGYGLNVRSNGLVAFDNTETGTFLFSNTALTLNTLYYIVATRDNVNNCRIYLNGSLDAGPSFDATVCHATTRDYRIGGVLEDAGSFFPALGPIFDPALYNYALSSAQVTAHWGVRNG